MTDSAPRRFRLDFEVGPGWLSAPITDAEGNETGWMLAPAEPYEPAGADAIEGWTEIGATEG